MIFEIPTIERVDLALLRANPYQIEHLRYATADLPEFNRLVLRGADIAQAHAGAGGGYFIGIKAVPTESPVGYPLSLGKNRLLDPPRCTSYCSGASFTAFIEALDLWNRSGRVELGADVIEDLRMQEPNGGRREDGVKFWGWWNADGNGCHFAAVQYSQIGTEIAPKDARPGDFMNIGWTSGIGHSVVFLGYATDPKEGPGVCYWSSQAGTNGMADTFAPLSRIRAVSIVRITHPERIAELNRRRTSIDPKAGSHPVSELEAVFR